MSPPAARKRPNTAESKGVKKIRIVETDSDTDADSDLEFRTKDGKRFVGRNPVPSKLLATSNQREVQVQKSSSGVLKSLQLYNFMCHSNFYKEWHSNLNFIIGENGSGKSALLTGILVGLGAKASLTSRTKAINNLIQKGKDHARTQITLLNTGALPVAKYGQEITIERTLAKTGSSTYKIGGGGGKWRPLRKSELDYILLSFNIQLDNPVAILNQEVAKNFLRSKDPRTKYTLFYEGTMLSKLEILLQEGTLDIQASQKGLLVHRDIISVLKKSLDDLNKRLSAFENLRLIQVKLPKLELEYLWSLVRDEEKRRSELEKKLEKVETDSEIINQKVAALEEKRVQVLAGNAENDHRQVQKEIKETEKALEGKRLEISKEQRAVQERRMKIRSNEPLIRNKLQEFTEASNALEQIKATAVVNEKEVMEIYFEKKAELDVEKKNILRTLQTLKSDGDQFKSGADRAREQMNGVKEQQANVQREIETKKRSLKHLRDSTTNKHAVYGPFMQALVAQMQANSRKFKFMPKGPLGAHFTVKDLTFAPLIESILGPNLWSFVVDNSEDMLVLKKMVKQIWGNHRGGQGNVSQPQMLCRKFATRPHDIRQFEARMEGIPTLLDLLEVDDYLVTNALCDFTEAEKILMFKNYTEAAKVMKDDTVCPRRCKMGYTLDWYKFTPYPDYSARVMPKKPRAALIRTSHAEQMSNLQGELRDLSETHAAFGPSIEDLKREEARLRNEFNERAKVIELNKQDLKKVEQNIQENERKKYKAPDVASHEEGVRELEEELAKCRRETEEWKSYVAEKQPHLAQLDQEKRELEVNIAQLVARISTAEAEKERIAREAEKIQLGIRKISSRLAELEKAKDPLKIQLEICSSEVERKLAQAEKSGERVPSDKTSEEVKSEFDTMKKTIREMQSQLGNFEKISNAHRSKKREMDLKVKEYKPTYRSWVILCDLVTSQRDFFHKKRAGISSDLSLTYNLIAAQRGYKGQLCIDHDKQELHFFICPDKSSNSKTLEAMTNYNKQSKKTLVEYSLGLSGGERSFSTICFIVSLWQVMECPFYMLDEFDVFMDQFNRKTSQQALIRHAKNFTKNQFFLFTPLDLIETPKRADAVVLKLFPPERNNENMEPPLV